MADNEYDYIIVGAGTAGCLLANRLSADANKRVLLLEAGKPDNYPWIHIPVGYLYCIGNPRTDWLYQTEADVGLNGRRLRYPRGKTLGGCSSINGMIYMRGQARDYDHWAKLTGNHEWCWDQVLPDFKAHENHYRLDHAEQAPADFADLHGHGGEWRIEKQRLRWDILDAFADAAAQAGFAHTADFNSGDNAGVGYFEVNQRQGWRWNTAKAFLRPAKKRNNFKSDYWPTGDQPALWNPRVDSANLHFIEAEDGLLYPLTPTGRFTIDRLRLNRSLLVNNRKQRAQRAHELILLQRYNEMVSLLENVNKEMSLLMDEQRSLLKEQRDLLRLLLRQ